MNRRIKWEVISARALSPRCGERSQHAEFFNTAKCELLFRTGKKHYVFCNSLNFLYFNAQSDKAKEAAMVQVFATEACNTL